MKIALKIGNIQSEELNLSDVAVEFMVDKDEPAKLLTTVKDAIKSIPEIAQDAVKGYQAFKEAEKICCPEELEEGADK